MMTLRHKITLLLAFMILTSLFVFCWFTSCMFHYTNEFKVSMSRDEIAIQAARKQSLKELKEKAETMGGEIREHLSKMEADLLKARKESEVFREYFLQVQNQVFGEIENF